MEIEARFRRRALLGESVVELNEELLRRLIDVPGLWMANAAVNVVELDKGTGESAAVDLSPAMRSGIRGAISYASRLPKAVVDRAISDDILTLRFRSDAVDFHQLATVLFPSIVEAFRPYRAALVTDLKQDLDDFESIVREAQRTKLDVDGRDTVFRLYAVNYFDDAICRRAFGVGSDALISTLQGKIAGARSLAAGALLELSRIPCSGDELERLGEQIRPALNGWR